MPAMTLGLAEVEERLHALRRRLNAVTAQHGTYVSLSAIILLAAALIILGLRASALTFRIATWGGATVAAGVVVWCAVFLRRRWLDVAATAHLADQRGQLTDRLATLNDLRVRPRPSRLAPVLVAQTLALGARWQVRRIAPRRIPRSLFLLVASLLALVSTTLVSRPAPPPAAARSNAGVGAVSAAGGAMGAAGDAADAVADQFSGGAEPLGSESASAHAAPRSGALPPPDGAPLKLQRDELGDQGREQEGSSLTALPDQLQQAIRRAFRAEAMDQPRQLAARSATSGGDGAGRRDDGQNDRSTQPRDAGDASKPGSQPPDAKNSTGTGPQKQPSGKEPGTSKGNQPGKQSDANVPGRKFDGAAPAAGDGSSPAGLMDAQATAATLGQEGPKTFKLTITSFLRAVEQKGNQPPQPAKRISTTGGPTTAGAGQGTLSDRQLNDDALRKAEIPPEYEDIVRRVYSARATP